MNGVREYSRLFKKRTIMVNVLKFIFNLLATIIYFGFPFIIIYMVAYGLITQVEWVYIGPFSTD